MPTASGSSVKILHTQRFSHFHGKKDKQSPQKRDIAVSNNFKEPNSVLDGWWATGHGTDINGHGC